MLTTDSVRTRHIGEATAQDIADQWNSVYPAMREILDTVIAAQCGAQHPTADVPALDKLRRELGQLDRGEFTSCTRSTGEFSVYSALVRVQEVLNVTSVGAPEKGSIYRLAGTLADVDADLTAQWRAEREPGVPAEAVDPGDRDRADSELEHAERGTR
ncbi:hypothetical protein [Streptomyces sp. NPDC020983]|uniref:hypothetical protein n=1 Tax=Streptomyces sp. NPDC020983 TaxID=3365106 RepID=UPI0037A4D970